jgi:phage major head subunit gpT-like protein
MQRERILLRDAVSSPSTWNAEASTVEAVIASNSPIARRDAKGAFNEVLDISGADLSRFVGASVLDGHQAGGVRNIIGVVTAARVEGNAIVATLQMSSRPELASVVRDIAEGIIRNLSIGYTVEQWGENTVAGIRTRTAKRFTPKEVSFVAIPADSSARTRTGEHEMNDVVTSDRPTINRQARELGNRSGCASALIDGLIDNEASLDEVRTAVLSDIHARGSLKINSASAHQTFDDPEFFRTTVAEALYHRIDPKTKPTEAAMQFVGLSIAEIARTTLTRNGINVTGLGADGVIVRAMNTTSDFPAVMANILDKSLRASYDSAPSGLKQVARQTTNINFRNKMRVMLDSTGFLPEIVPESGEFKMGSMMDMSEGYAVQTFGKIFNISRQALVNDDMGAFGDISRRLGIGAAQFEANTLATIVTSNPTMNEDSIALFHAAHGNYVASGSGAAPSVTTLTAARLAMRAQKGLGGGLISIVPSTLVVGPDLETLAEQLLTQIHPITVDGVNPFSKLKAMVVEPRLPQYGWYLVDGDSDGLEFAYLASSPGPQLESRLGFTVDGLQTRVRVDFGGGFVDHRSWYFNAGH